MCRKKHETKPIRTDDIFEAGRSQNPSRQQAIQKTEGLSIILKPAALWSLSVRVDAKRVGINWLVEVELSELSYPISRKGSALRIDGQSDLVSVGQG